MKKVVKSLTRKDYFSMLLTLILILFFGSCEQKNTKSRTASGAYYTCPMHPQIHEDKPGVCPICGMTLILVDPSSEQQNAALDTDLNYLTEPATKTVTGSFEVTEPVPASELTDTLFATGFIGFDEQAENSVSTRVSGRIEKLYVKYTNQHIQKGQPLMRIYSPQLISAERDLLQTLNEHDSSLAKGLKEQLLNLGMNFSEVQEVIRSGKPLQEITIYSPYSGISRETTSGQNMSENSSGNENRNSMTDNQKSISMNLSSASKATFRPANEPELLAIQKGMYVSRGQIVFSIQSLNQTWAILNIFNQNIGQIHKGDAVNVFADADSSHVLKGEINFIPPYRTDNEKTSRVRVYLNKLPANWKIGTLIHGQIIIRSNEQKYFVPLSAVNQLGLQNAVWVQDKKRPDLFHVRFVKVGLRIKDSIQIINGINQGEKIVKNAAYMVGSDSFIGE